MSPEYAMHGQFSEKSDVYSFGVIIIEIISRKRNARSPKSKDFDDLLSYVSILSNNLFLFMASFYIFLRAIIICIKLRLVKE